MSEQPDWMKEDMWSLREESPYYHEMKETLRDHYREMEWLRAEQRMDDYLDSLDYAESDDEEDE